MFTPSAHPLCLIAGDDGRVGASLARLLAERGWKVVMLTSVHDGDGEAQPADGMERTILAPEAEQAEQVRSLQERHGPLGVFIYLHPVLPPGATAHSFISAADREPIERVFLLLRHLRSPLQRAAEAGGRGALLMVARLDGALGLGANGAFRPASGALFGLGKTLRQEWPQVFCRTVDLDPEIADEQAARHILAELHDPDITLAETGYGWQGRVTLVAAPAMVPALPAEPAAIRPESVFVVSGGGRGITARCAVEMARLYRCRFVLLGRSGLEPVPDWAWGSDEAALKRRLLAEATARGEKLSPPALESACRDLAARQEIQSTLRAIEQAGGQALYACADVTNAEAVKAAIEAATLQLGPVTGVIHGAGSLADKRLEKKTARDFAAVYGPKVEGLANLLAAVPPEQLEYLVLFSSVAAFFGNLGQADYALANEVLNKAAHRLKRLFPACRVLALNWGPWDGGMVSAELKRSFERQQIAVIPPQAGAKAFLAELATADGQPLQRIIGSPLVQPPAHIEPAARRVRIERRLNLADNPFLPDHAIAGKPVLPFTCAFAWIAAACEQVCPGYTAYCYEEARILKGIVMGSEQDHLCTLELEEIPAPTEGRLQFLAKISSRSSRGKAVFHYACRVTLARQWPDGDIKPDGLSSRPTGVDASPFYASGVLFHGPCFQGIERLLTIDADGLSLQCRLPPIDRRTQGQFPVRFHNPFALDVQLQGMLIWTHRYCHKGCLPTRVERYEQFAPMPFGEPFYVRLQVQNRGANSVTVDLTAHAAAGRILSRLHSLQGTLSERLQHQFQARSEQQLH
ncbi:SDR family NAD(P)-dependent oxidoreductase [Gloeobacter violaceus]|uniref:Glr2849 protein n=1 Tax=Gloeobacter violaceus (strain ATCC 29082 / PCC 7421) TaxID=251221 RepID=Q7NCX7_GLOVI|nr:SDR family NAD(P)-dependent oxidoreductase [Gloeobacter violaceus]BAC90790.1 glr2849 [Gloeobacter violaceus PCC 7421]